MSLWRKRKKNRVSKIPEDKTEEDKKSKIISLVGLTASGKSAVGIKLAGKFNGEIISCDSRQVYRGLDIGTAKVTDQDRALVPHYLIDIAEPGEHFDVFKFKKLACDAIEDIIRRGKVPILVGGTGLYSRSIVENYSFAGKKTMSVPLYRVLQICLMPPKEYLRPLIERRIATRLDNGMFQETQGLLKKSVEKQWLQNLGLEYHLNIEFLDGRISLDEYKRQLSVKTMQFAKRQRTWFKREKNTHFLTDPEKFYDDCENLVAEFLA